MNANAMFVYRLYRYSFILFFLLLSGPYVYGQQIAFPENVPGDTVVTAFVPAGAYASDIGLLGAVIFNRFRYYPGVDPYVTLTEARVQASTKGLFELRLVYEQTETFGRPIRSRWAIYGERLPFDRYFGIGNQTPFDKEKWDDRVYDFETRRTALKWAGRRTVYRTGQSGARLDVTAGAGVSYEIPADNEDQLMGQERPKGIKGGWVNTIGVGMLWENRDSEFAATRGNRFEVSAEWAPDFFYSDYPMVLLSADMRQFITLPVPWLRPVLALRGAGSWASGSVPYWKRPYLGDEYTLRGYPMYRFRGDAALFYNIELRTWLYENPYYQIKFGIHGFHDAGRVFFSDDGDGFDDLFRNYHRTFGAGIATALFTPDFILRIDTGFSDEMYRLYMNVGYMF